MLQVWQHKEKADGIMSGGGGILSYHAACLKVLGEVRKGVSSGLDA